MDEETVWPPPPVVPQDEGDPASSKADRFEPAPSKPGRDWAGMAPGIIMATFLLLCFVLALWFLGRLATL